ncbi:hypothetical protein [Neobacillus drentensis]
MVRIDSSKQVTNKGIGEIPQLVSEIPVYIGGIHTSAMCHQDRPHGQMVE